MTTTADPSPPERPTRLSLAQWQALTPRERRFVAHLAAHPQATQGEAALAAGISPKRATTGAGSEMANRPHVAAAIAALHAAALDEAQVDAAFVVREAIEVLRGAKADGQWGAANGTLTLLAKMRGGLTDKLAVSFRDVTTLSDAELEAEAKTLGLA